MPEFERPVPEGPPAPYRRSPLARAAAAASRLPQPVRIGVAMVAAVSAVAATGTAARLTRDPSPPATRFELSVPPGHGLDLPGRVTSVDLAGDAGAAVSLRCTGHRCRPYFAVLRGDRWRARPLPAALDAGAGYDWVNVVLLPGGGALLRTPSRDWFSPYDGRSWRAAPQRPAGPVDRIRQDRLTALPSPTARWVEVGRRCAGGRAGVISSATGRVAPLTGQPPLEVCWAAPYADPAGRHWVTGTDPVDARPAVAYTRDGGATWRTRRLPASPGLVAGTEVSWSGTRPYAVTLAGRYPGRNLLRGVHTPGPGGWRHTSRWPDSDPLAVRGELVVRRDGSLFAVGGTGAVLISDDGGGSFAPRGHPLRLGPVIRTRDGWVTQLQDVTYAWLHSTDGFTWSRLAVW